MNLILCHFFYEMPSGVTRTVLKGTMPLYKRSSACKIVVNTDMGIPYEGIRKDRASSPLAFLSGDATRNT